MREAFFGRPGSLRLRFLLAVMLWVTLGIGAIWLFATRIFINHVEQSYYSELDVHVRELARFVSTDAHGRPVLLRQLSDPRYDIPRSGFYWQVYVPDQPLLRSPSLAGHSLDQTIAHEDSTPYQVNEGPNGAMIVHGYLQRGPRNEPIHVVIATDERELDRLISSFTRELTLWLIALGGLLLATGAAIVGFGLRPLDELGQAIARLRTGRSLRLEGRYPSEIAPLASDLNEYIGRTSEMTERARVQAGNLAHSLRTPLAVIMDEAERLSTDPRTAASAASLVNQASMMEQQIEFQLAKARFSSGPRAAGVVSQLPELLTPIIGAMHRLHPHVTFRLYNRTGEDLLLPVDPVDLSELLSILLDNAGKWAASRATVSLERHADGAVSISVADDGPGMSPQQIAQAFTIGMRFDRNKPGSGLGLAIAREISEALGAELQLSGPADGGRGGLTARVSFPA